MTNFASKRMIFDRKNPPGFFIAILIVTITCLMLGVFDKAAFGAGGLALGANAQQNSSFVAFSRVISFVILIAVLALLVVVRPSRRCLTYLFGFWAPLAAFIVARMFFLDGDVGVILRSANFLSVILAGVVLAASDRASVIFYSCIYYITFATNFTGILLYFLDLQFSYSTDGYGRQFVAFYYQKDLLSSTAAIGAIISVTRLKSRWSRFDAIILVSQVFTLFLASTLSSVLALTFSILALLAPRTSILGAGLFAITLPFFHFMFSSVVGLFGKDATFTGRTVLWDYVAELSKQNPLLGYGFQHASSDDEWMRLLSYYFVNDALFIPHSHNLWIEALYKFGIIGILILAMTLIILPAMRGPMRSESLGDKISRLLLPFLLAKSALIVPFLSSDALSYIWAFALSHFMLNRSLAARQRIE